MPQEREFANPKYVVRQILKALPKTTNEHDCWIGITILALWAHGNGFLDKGDLERGDIILLGTVSYSQVAEFCNCAYSTAKWRLAQLRDKWNLVRWHKRKKGIE